MTIVRTNVWRPLARVLADQVAPDSPVWWNAVARIPRHALVPEFWDTAKNPPELVTNDDDRWLDTVYSDVVLTTQLQQHPDYPQLQLPTSSTSAPSLMASMLEALDVTAGRRVLELGTGTGYNAALMCTPLGDDNVFSVDLDPHLVDRAQRRLGSIGYRPHLNTGDSKEGYAPGAPYDRVIATHAVEEVPYAWVEQTRPGGVILVDVRSASSADIGRIARLEVQADGTAVGHFRHCNTGGFMAARTNVASPDVHLGLPSRDLRDATRRGTDIDVNVLSNPDFRFALWAYHPQLTIPPGPEPTISTRDGAWAAPAAPRKVDVAGPVDLWAMVEKAYARWCASGRPRVEDFTITVTPEGQAITAE